MPFIIYVLLVLVVFGFLVTTFWFLKLFASLSSLISTTHTTARGSWDAATGGSTSLFRVLSHTGNRNANKALIRSAIFLTGSFAATMCAALLLVELNSRHCVLKMEQRASNGTVTSVCNSSR